MAWMLTRFGGITLPEAMPEETMTPLPALARITATAAGIFDGDGAGRSDPAYPLRLSYSAIVEPAAGWKATVDALRAAVGTRARLYRTGSDASIQWCVARLVGMPYDRTVKNYNWVEVKLEFAQLSRWQGVNHASWALDEGELLDAGLLFDSSEYRQTITGASMTQTVLNGGNVPVTDVVFTIVAGTAASLIGVTLWGPGQQLLWTGTIPARGTLLIDCAAHRVTLNGANAYGQFALGVYHAMGDWARLQPGNNPVILQVSSANYSGASWSIEYKDAWA